MAAALWWLLTPPAMAQPAYPLARARDLNAEIVRHYQAGRYAEAMPLAREALALREAALGPSHPDVAQSLNNLAQLLLAAGEYSAARPIAERVVYVNETTFGPSHPSVGASLDTLAAVLHAMGDYAGARPLAERAVRVTEAAVGANHPDMGVRLSNLGEVLRALGDLGAARAVAERALQITEAARGPDHEDVGIRLNNLAAVLEAAGEYGDAQATYERALRISEAQLGASHPTTAARMNNLAALLQETGDYAGARRLYERALVVTETALGPDHPTTANRVNNLASLLRDTGDLAGARALYERALEITERALGFNHPDVGVRLGNLAGVLQEIGDHRTARVLHERALRVTENALGPHHPDVALRLNNLAGVLRVMTDDAAARPLYERALRINERALGPTHSAVATSLGNLAALLQAAGDLAAAQPLHEEALRITEAALGPTHPQVGVSLNNLATLLEAAGQHARARALYERARRLDAMAAVENVRLGDEASRGLRRSTAIMLGNYMGLLAGIAREPARDPAAVAPEATAFVVAEQARGRSVQAALARAGARAAAGTAATAVLARRVQDASDRREALRKQVIAEYGRPPARRDTARLAQLRQMAAQLDTDFERAAQALRTAFPKYEELASPPPINAADARQLLRPGEALLSVFTLSDRALVWVLRPGHPLVYRDIPITRDDLRTLVHRVRQSLDQSANADLGSGRLTAFDVVGAHELYRLLLAPVAGALEGVGHLFVVPDEILLPLPFGVLVTKAAGEPFRTLADRAARAAAPPADDLVEYAKVAWLAAEHAITVLPSATSLRVLRQAPAARAAPAEPFIGFGDPLLAGRGARRGAPMVVVRGVAMLAELRMLDALPGTRAELHAIAHALGADASRAIYVGARATKPNVPELDAAGRLGRARVLAFATHGLLAGEIAGLRQPALVLTPPSQLAPDDDGLLSLDDVARLTLTSTDWVVLSACNTGGGDGSAEGLSGLARAFFFAGAPALLVSHWSVDDRATQALMTEVFQRWTASPSMARAEALRQAMLALMRRASGSTAYFAHPFAWAPFFVVGEGR
jgi:tetratricopeptide (TPR) repeat protein